MRSNNRSRSRSTPRRSDRERRLALLGLAIALSLFTVGCSAYEVRGRVIRGDFSFIAVVDADDPRLTESGIGVPGARVRLLSDPNRLNREVQSEAVSDADGSFKAPFDEIGAGMLLYEVGLKVRKAGFEPAEMSFSLPQSSKRVLVLLGPGYDDADWSDDDLMKEAERFR